MRLTVVKYIRTVKPKNAEGLVAQIYTQIKRDFGRVVEPFSLHSPSPRLLAGAWMASRESELTGRVPREDKEAVAASISKLNQCPYCVDAHTIMLGATGENKLANQISSGRYGSITESRTRAIVKWALATRTPDSEVLRSPPFSPKEAPEIIGTAVFYHYLNSMVTVFLGETPLPTSLPWLRGPLKRFASGLFSKAASRPKKEGESLRLLEEAKLPSDLGWT
ncbi:carboxymuconolactone decarboxylase family protein [Candidatus Bathyarchaeota archaeon]|nr:carboxymuconolactone decarboxylase family protein [Candidatus Bathyarchaeota archaeon]